MTIIDQLRAKCLKRVLKIAFVKRLYQAKHLRILVGYLIITSLALSIAVFRSDILLILGPLLYGYLHLVTSYKYSSVLISPTMSLSQKQKNILYGLLGITFIEIMLQVYRKLFNGFLVPNGFVGLVLSLIFLSFLYLKHGIANNFLKKIIFISLGIAIICFSWEEPLIFVSMTLFAHNWIAFVAWIKLSKDKNNLLVSILGLLIFTIIHTLVLTGVFDSYFTLFEEYFWGISGDQEVGWLLAPWSDDEIIWRRGLCLYTFGLSVHYFIWIKAIPENVYKNNTPVSFKTSFNSFYEAYGSFFTYSIIGIAAFGIIVWLLWFEIGSLIYFTISNMHAWTELVMLSLAFTVFGISKKIE